MADAANVPLPQGCSDLVLAAMSLHDIDDLDGALTEAPEAGRWQRFPCFLMARAVKPMESRTRSFLSEAEE